MLFRRRISIFATLLSMVLLVSATCFVPENEDLRYTRYRIPHDAPRRAPIYMKLGSHQVCVSAGITVPGEYCRVYPVTKAGARDAVLKHKKSHAGPVHWYIAAYRIQRTMRCEATCMSAY